MNKPEKEYLKELIKNVQKKFEMFEYPALDLINSKVTYISTKKNNHLGIKLGLSSFSEMKKNKVKESATIRSNCTYYNKFYNTDGKVVKIDCYINGHDRLSNSYIAFYESGYRYLFPYYADKKAIGLYTFVTHFENDKVVEEYMVEADQIFYEKYEYNDNGQVGYYCINYRPEGKYPILGESEGKYMADTLEYVEESQNVWYQNVQ